MNIPAKISIMTDRNGEAVVFFQSMSSPLDGVSVNFESASDAQAWVSSFLVKAMVEDAE